MPPSEGGGVPYSFSAAAAALEARSAPSISFDSESTVSAATPSTATTSQTATVKEKRFTNKEKREIVFAFARNLTIEKKLRRGLIGEFAAKYKVSRVTINNNWRTTKEDVIVGRLPDVDRKYKGQKQRLFIDLEVLRTVPKMERTNINDLAIALKTSASTAYRLVVRSKIRSHSSALKPYWTDENKVARMQWVLDHINLRSITRSRPIFKSGYGRVDIDEKWFHLTRANKKIYLLPDEIDPHRSCKSKRFITKIMFMAAVARPIYDDFGNVVFDGKLGIWPFTVKIPAMKSSINRPKGTLEEKPVESINMEVTKRCMIDKILPTIKEKWPQGYGKIITIQQDNARSLIEDSDPDFRKAAEEGGWQITLENQPPNSPDMNCLDLGFFRVIQGIQHKKKAKTMSQLVDAITAAYDETKVKTFKYVFLSLMNCMKEVLKAKGNNNYKLPHMNKKKLDRLGILPENVKIDMALYKDSLKEVEHQIAVNKSKAEAKQAAKEAAATAAKAAASAIKAAARQEAAKVRATARDEATLAKQRARKEEALAKQTAREATSKEKAQAREEATIARSKAREDGRKQAAIAREKGKEDASNARAIAREQSAKARASTRLTTTINHKSKV